jgi:hypothetical protein
VRQSSATTAIGSAATTTTTTVWLAAANSTWGWSPLGVPPAATTTTATETAVAPLPGSLEGSGPQVSGAPFFLISLFNMPTDLNPSFACQGFLPLCSQGHASIAPAATAETASSGPQAPDVGLAAAAPTPSGVAAEEGVPTAPMAATASTTAMSSSTPSAATEEAVAAPAAAIEVDAGGASSSNPPPTLEETEVIFGWRLWSGAEPEAAPVSLPRVLSRAHQALQETEVAILREWEALEAEHQHLSD